MRAIASLSAGILLLICAGTANAQAAKGVADRNAPLVKALEALYGEAMQAARRGDLEGYWRLHTAASRTRPPTLDSARLRMLAGMLPPLDTMDFVRLDNSGKAARALYRWRKEDAPQYSVIVYRQEEGQWRIDDVSVHHKGNPARAAAPAPATAPAPSAAAAPTTAVRPAASSPQTSANGGQSNRAQELLKAWESGGADAPRTLSGPKL